MSDMTLPKHIGFIIDGNRRWAVSRGLKPYEGHSAGSEVLKEIVDDVFSRGIACASVYVFSTENWKRSPFEVKKLLDLLYKLVTEEVDTFIKKGVRLRIAGARDKRLSAKMLAAFEDAEARTSHLTKGTLIVCINYGGRQEIVDACKKIVQSGANTKEIDESMLEKSLYVDEVPPLDVIVRTSGEQRLSNFMLWQGAYAELMFIEKTWPEMTKEDVTDILNEYANRNRRFGK